MMNRSRLEIIFDIPIPFTPHFSDTGSDDTSTVSSIILRISFAAVIA